MKRPPISILKTLAACILLLTTSGFVYLLLPSLVNPDSNLLIKSFLMLNMLGWMLSFRYLWKNHLNIWKKK